MSSMIQHDVIQGTPEWLDLKEGYFSASEAVAMMGCSPYGVTRNDLKRAKATLTPKEYSRFLQEKVLDKGHKFEDLARPIFEEQIGMSLYAVTASNGIYLASYDGLTMDASIGFEHKSYNNDLAAMVKAGKIPDYIYWQLEHQFLVCDDLEVITLVVSNGTPLKWEQCEYRRVPGRREELIAGWRQFAEDVANYKFEPSEAEPVGRKPISLPALYLDVTGSLTTKDNLEEFTVKVNEMIAAINKTPKTDQEFADAAQTVKSLGDGEDAIELTIEQSISKVKNLADLHRAMRDAQSLMRTTRLNLEKVVEKRKKDRKDEIVDDAETELNALFAQADAEFAHHKVLVTGVTPNFYAVVKGKRSFDMMKSACDDALAKAKIELTELRDRIRTNLQSITELGKDHPSLFPDKQDLAYLSNDHLVLTINARIDKHKQELVAADTDRKVKHRNTITALQAAGQPDDSVPYDALLNTRKRLQEFNPGAMQEFAIEAEQARDTSLAAVNARIKLLLDKANEEAAERERLAAQKIADTKKAAELVIDHRTTSAYSIDGNTAAGYSRSPAVVESDLSDDESIPGLDDLDPTDYSIHAAAADGVAKVMSAVDADEARRADLVSRIIDAEGDLELTKTHRVLLRDIKAYLLGRLEHAA